MSHRKIPLFLEPVTVIAAVALAFSAFAVNDARAQFFTGNQLHEYCSKHFSTETQPSQQPKDASFHAGLCFGYVLGVVDSRMEWRGGGVIGGTTTYCLKEEKKYIEMIEPVYKHLESASTTARGLPAPIYVMMALTDHECKQHR